MNNYKMVSDGMVGRIAVTEERWNRVKGFIEPYGGDHVEIGTLWGGTAVLTALEKSAGYVYTIDPLTDNGYYGGVDIKLGKRPTAEDIQYNFQRFDVRRLVTHVDDWSNPWPLEDQKFDTAFIDGNHSWGGVLQDFLNLKDIVLCKIIIDDYGDPNWPDTSMAVASIVLCPEWSLEYAGDGIAVLERK